MRYRAKRHVIGYRVKHCLSNGEEYTITEHLTREEAREKATKCTKCKVVRVVAKRFRVVVD
jgi:hypothetical protein